MKENGEKCTNCNPYRKGFLPLFLSELSRTKYDYELFNKRIFLPSNKNKKQL